MSEHGISPYGLAGNWCEECGQAKSFRLWPGMLTGCKTCDEVITRHLCTGRPDIESLADGQSWECPDCDSKWTPRTEAEDCPDCCGACGHLITGRSWDSEAGDRIDTAPRHEPQSWWPFRNLISRPRSALQPMGSCYRTRSGNMVHVKPGCRC